MVERSPFQSNLSLWREKHLSFGMDLDTIDEPFKQAQTPFYSCPEDILENDLLISYGIFDFFDSSKKFQEWIKKNRPKCVVLLAETKEEMFFFLQAKWASSFLKQPECYLFYWEDDEILAEAFKKLFWTTFSLTPTLFSSPQKQQKKKEQLQDMVETIHQGVFLVGSDYSDFGVRAISNTFANLAKQKEIYLLENLKGSFSKVPAIICGGGPSLDENINELKNLKEKALIFAGGSALAALSHQNIIPHFGASVDKMASLDRFKQAHLYDIPYFYQLSSSREIFSLMTHPQNILVGNYGSYPLEDDLEKELNISQEKLDFGWTVTTLLMQVAQNLGCDPIILVGMDLFFENGVDYASGIISLPHENPKRIKKDEKKTTQRDWIMAEKWVKKMIASSSTTFINCSFGRWKEKEDFKRVKNSYLDQDRKLSLRVEDVLKKMNPVTISEKKIKSFNKTMVGSLREVENTIHEALKNLEGVMFDPKKNSLNEKLFIFLEQQKIVTTLLAPLWKVFCSLIEKESESLKTLVPSRIEKLIIKLLFYERIIGEYQWLKELG